MKKIVPFASICLVIMLANTPTPRAADDPDLNRLEQEYLEAVQTFYPVTATRMGITAYDQRFADYSSRSVGSMIDKLKDFERAASRINEDRITPSDRISLAALQADISQHLVNLDKRKLYRTSAYLHVREVVDGMFYLARMDHMPPMEQLFPILQRMRSVPDYLSTARQILREPSPLSVEAALSLLDDGMELYRKVGGEFMNKLPERADEILKTSTRAREAMNDFAAYLTTVKAAPPGSFAVGKDRFDELLEEHLFLGFDSDSLLALSALLVERYQAEYDDYAMYFEEQHQNGRDDVFVPPSFSRSDVLAYYQWETEQAHQETIAKDIVSLPPTLDSIVVVETPSYLRVLVNNTTYVPIPPFSGGAQAMVWVRPLPEQLDERQLELRYRYVHRRGFRINAAIQAYPGQHTQAEWARAGNDDFRKWLQSPMLIDGWALYCEEMVNRPGFHGDTDPALWLAYLDELRMRAVLVTAEVYMHREEWTLDEAIEKVMAMLNVETGSMRDLMAQRVTRAALFPGVHTAALLGKLEIDLLREAVRGADGDTFSLGDFHSRLLRQGAVPPTLLWEEFGLNR